MIITTRRTYNFIELKVDEIETTIFKDSTLELQKMIWDLEEVIDDLKSYLPEKDGN